MTTRIMPEEDYQRMLADAKLARATALQANVCITRLVAALAEVAPTHPLLTELPFSQYRTDGEVAADG